MKKIFSITALLAVFSLVNTHAALKVGDTFVENGRTYEVIGTNLIPNPSFDSGVTNWLSGANGTISPVTNYTTGGVDGGAYICPTANTGVGGSGSIGTGWAIASGKTYVFDHYIKKMTETNASREGYIVTSLVNAVGTAETKVMRTDTVNAGNAWTLNRLVFTNTVPYGYIQFRARWLSGRFGFDDFLLAEVQEKADNSFLLNLIAQCEEIAGGKETVAFEAAIAVAKSQVNINDAKVLNAAMAELQERLLDYRIANAAEGYIVDVTGRYVKNADFTNLLTDWQCGTIAVGNGINPIIYSHFGAATREMELQNGTTAVSDNYCQQTITKLRKGYYRFGAQMVAWNDANNADSIVGVYLMCNGALTPVSTHGAAGTNAKTFYVEGVVTDSSIVVGMKTVKTNATKIYMDNVTLEYMGFDASIYMTSLRDKVKDYIVVSGSKLLPGVLDELKKAVKASETETIDEDTLAVYYENLDKAFKQATNSLVLINDLKAMILDFNNLLITYSEWPGFGAAQATLVAANGLIDSGPTEIATSKYSDLVNMIATVKQAKRDYILSQNATAAAPADLTLLVQAPSFRAPGMENIETATQSKEGWATANVSSSGDFRTGFNQFKTCYNSWSNSFTSMDLYQNITGLPAGIYTISCSAITQPYDLNDQHAYVGSSLTKAVSPNMTTTNWYDATTSPSGSGEWERLTTRKVVLLAGDTLRMGFASTHNPAAVDGTGAARGQNGWFSVTDFSLQYYGNTGTDAVVSDDVQNAQALASSVELKGDRSQVQAHVAAAADRLASNAGAAKVYESLNAATKLASASRMAHVNFLAPTSNYQKVFGMASADTLSANLDALLTAALTLVGDSLNLPNATYTNLTSLNSKLAAYLTYVPAYKAAEAFVASVASTNYVVALQNKMAAQKAALSSNLVTPAEITADIAALNTAMADAKLSLVLTGGNNQDMTSFIVNQPLAASSGTVAPNGWTVTGSKDAITKVGQYIDDSATKRYFDTYASSGGITFTGKQAIKVPNGTYTVAALARTPAAGVTIFATGDKNYFTEVPLRTYDKLVRPSTGLADSTGQVSDTYGPIWEAAAEGSAIKLANSGKGRGWGQVVVDDVVVNNHEITIGFSSDSTFTGIPFKGTWFSVVDFTLTLKTMGDNTNWVITGMKDIQGNKEVAKVEYFLLSGVRVARIVKGFNIVKTTYSDGSVKVTKIFQQ